MKNGKIAVCPLAIREEVNRRLLDGQQGDEILAWLNAQPEVQRVMKDRFKGNPIIDSNLTQWRQGGYQEWLDEGKKLRAMEAMVVAFARTAQDTGVSKALDGCVVALVSTIYPVLETLQKGKPSLDELEQAARIVTMLQNAEIAKQRVPQRDTLNAIRQGELALRTQSFALKEESVAVEQETMMTEAEKHALYWKQRAREDARLAREARKGGKVFTERFRENGMVTTIQHTVEGTTVVSRTVNGQPVEITREQRELWERKVGPSFAKASEGKAASELAALADEHGDSDQLEEVARSEERVASMTGGEKRVASMTGGDPQSAQGQKEETTVTVLGGHGDRETRRQGDGEITVTGNQLSVPSQTAQTTVTISGADAGQVGSGGGGFLVTGGEAIMRVMSVAETKYERDLDERDRRMKIKEEFRRRRLEYLGITEERLRQAL